LKNLFSLLKKKTENKSTFIFGVLKKMKSGMYDFEFELDEKLINSPKQILDLIYKFIWNFPGIKKILKKSRMILRQLNLLFLMYKEDHSL